jgi:hypothetical protein
MFHESATTFFWSIILVEFGVAFGLSTLLAAAPRRNQKA